MSSKDNHDASRDQYISHKLYLERRHGNRYYNLGYMTYKGIVAEPQTITPTYDILKDCIKNFDIALMFNPNDIDAKERKRDLCLKYGENATISQIITNNDINVIIKNAARQEFRECKC